MATPDTEANTVVIVGIGAAGGLFASVYIAISEKLTPRQIITTVILALGLGSGAPGLVMHFMTIEWPLAWLIGFLVGLGCLGIAAAWAKLIKKAADRPDVVVAAIAPRLKDAIRGMIKDDKAEDQKKLETNSGQNSVSTPARPPSPEG